MNVLTSRNADNKRLVDDLRLVCTALQHKIAQRIGNVGAVQSQPSCDCRIGTRAVDERQLIRNLVHTGIGKRNLIAGRNRNAVSNRR